MGKVFVAVVFLLAAAVVNAQYVLSTGFPTKGSYAGQSSCYWSTSGATESGIATGGTISGPINYTWTWSGTGPPPAAVLFKVVVSAEWGGQPSPPGSCADGMGDPATPATGDPLTGQTSSGSWYVCAPANAATLSYTANPTATVAAGFASVSVTVTPVALDIHFTDSNGQGVDNARTYLIGQNVQAQLVNSTGLTLVSGSESWSASGGAPFLSYSPGQAPTAPPTPIPSPDQVTTFSGYFAQSGSPSITCSGSFAVPSGWQPAGTMQFTATRMFGTENPVLQSNDPVVGTQGGYPTSAPDVLVAFGLSFNDPDYNNTPTPCGIYFPAEIPSGGSGRFYFVQTVNLARSRSNSSGSQSLGL